MLDDARGPCHPARCIIGGRFRKTWTRAATAIEIRCARSLSRKARRRSITTWGRVEASATILDASLEEGIRHDRLDSIGEPALNQEIPAARHPDLANRNDEISRIDRLPVLAEDAHDGAGSTGGSQRTRGNSRPSIEPRPRPRACGNRLAPIGERMGEGDHGRANPKVTAQGNDQRAGPIEQMVSYHARPNVRVCPQRPIKTKLSSRASNRKAGIIVTLLVV